MSDLLRQMSLDEMIQGLEYPDLISLKRSEKTIRELFLEQYYLDIFASKQAEFYNRINDIQRPRDDRLADIYRLDPVLQEISYGTRCIRIPLVTVPGLHVQKLGTDKAYIRGVMWQAPEGRQLRIESVNGVEYPCVSAKRRLF